jgi:hypothetical protein
MAPLINVAALLLADHRYLLSVEAGKSRDYSRIVGIPPVAVYLNKIRKYRREDVHRVWTIGMTRTLNAFHGGDG